MQATTLPIHQGCIIDSVIQPEDQCEWMVNFLSADKTIPMIPKEMTEHFPVNDFQEVKTAETEKEPETDDIHPGNSNISASDYVTLKMQPSQAFSLQPRLNVCPQSYTDVMQQRWIATGRKPMK